MRAQETIIARLRARHAGRAVLVRNTRTISPDPSRPLGIVCIRVVTEDHIQALAFGIVGQNPKIITRENPLSRDSSDLEPFAEWLCDAVDKAVREGKLRVWVPHQKTMEMLGVFGRRYEHNTAASATLRRAGLICRLLAEEAEHEGNQIVAIGHDLLLAHGVTGQLPIEDTHPAAVLTWFDPPKDRSTIQVAAERSLLPASGILPNIPGRKDDDLVERLRKELKNARHGHTQLRHRLDSILRRAITYEWQLLLEERRLFDALECDPLTDESVYAASMGRFDWRLSTGASAPKHEIAISNEIVARSDAHKTQRNSEIQADPQIRAQHRREGRVVVGTITRVDQSKPCSIQLSTTQEIVRFRRDDNVKSIGSRVRSGYVRNIGYNARTGTTNILIEITSGIRGASSLLGTTMEWFESDDFPVFLRRKVLEQTRARNCWVLSGGAAPQVVISPANKAPSGCLIQIANSLRAGR
jgi:hypothetical protein